jgi:hypothetical protein
VALTVVQVSEIFIFRVYGLGFRDFELRVIRVTDGIDGCGFEKLARSKPQELVLLMH